MSVCTFIASDFPLPEFAPSQDYPLEININNGTINDGGADDNYFLIPFQNAADYTDKKYAVCLEWNATDGRAMQIIEYVKTAMQEAEVIELWHVWLMEYHEFEDRPFIHKSAIAIDNLTPAHIRKLDCADIWNMPDKRYPQRPSFYCLSITR